MGEQLIEEQIELERGLANNMFAWLQAPEAGLPPFLNKNAKQRIKAFFGADFDLVQLPLIIERVTEEERLILMVTLAGFDEEIIEQLDEDEVYPSLLAMLERGSPSDDTEVRVRTPRPKRVRQQLSHPIRRKPSDEWKEDALCAQTDPEAFFPEKGGSTREAKKVCLSCEVRDDCLDDALSRDEKFGIWGGLSERERRRLKRSQKQTVIIPDDIIERITIFADGIDLDEDILERLIDSSEEERKKLIEKELDKLSSVQTAHDAQKRVVARAVSLLRHYLMGVSAKKIHQEMQIDVKMLPAAIDVALDDLAKYIEQGVEDASLVS